MSMSRKSRSHGGGLLRAVAIIAALILPPVCTTGAAMAHYVAQGNSPESQPAGPNPANSCNQNRPVAERTNPYNMTTKQFEVTASVLFHRCHRYVAPDEAAPSQFRANLDFPTMPPTLLETPWKKYDPIEAPEDYLNAVLDYAMMRCGGDHVDWDGQACGWFHAPWMHDLREPMFGMTEERGSRPGELHPSQTVETGNWAIGLYNEIGGYGFHRIWGDHAHPKTRGFSFEDGTVAVKLLFSLATPEQVPYLRFAKTRQIHDGEKIVTARLIQLDLLVKDGRLTDGKRAAPNDDLTGWVMGSFLYNGAIETTPRCDKISDDIEACEQARWRDRMIPIGLQWGNDPQIYDTNPWGQPVQHWQGPAVKPMFEPLRLMNGQPASLGRHGRMNGPVDNHRSTCLACHGRALDFGRYEEEEDALRLVPFIAHEDPTSQTYPDASTDELKRFFRNLNSNEPFLAGTQSLDYSLQAAVGLHKFREWVAALPVSTGVKSSTTDLVSSPGYTSPDAVTGPLRLASWNLANLHHQSGEALRPAAKARRDVDYQRLAEMAVILNADIIAVQEAGSAAALARVFPPDQYHLVMADTYTPGDEFKSVDERDIHTAFVLARDKFPKLPQVETIGTTHVEHLQVDKNDVFDERPTRAAMSVEFTYQDQRYAILNVHLKSGCNNRGLSAANEEVDERHAAFACRTLTAQLAQVENWFELQFHKGFRVIMMGDFNRRLNDVYTTAAGAKPEDFWADLNDGYPIALRKGPLGGQGGCWSGGGDAHKSSIDFIIGDEQALDEKTAQSISKVDYGPIIPAGSTEYDTADDHYKLSDHCPVVVELGG